MKPIIIGLAVIAAAGISFVASLAPLSADDKKPLPSEAPVPDKMPFDIPYGAPIDLAKAKDLIVAAEAEAKTHDWKMDIAVVDPNGDLVAFERMDDAQLASIAVSQNKARTAARYRRPTAVWYDAIQTGQVYIPTLDPQLVASPGGFPLISAGKLIGAIGCSGGASLQDAVVCKAALAKLQ
jgi:glc operon protein GlcG